MYRIRCNTLFDITQTGVMNRSKTSEIDVATWVHKRNTQCNFDTILQVISLRSQPDIIKVPIKVEMTIEDYDKFGFLYDKEEPSFYWRFEFEVQHASVFDSSLLPLGELYKDCSGVPMIQCEGQHSQCPKFLDISAELQNVHFEVL